MKTEFSFKTWTVAACVVLSGMWLSKSSVADPIIFGSGGNQFTMEFVTIGNAGNLADTTGNPNPAGAVAYDYKIGKFEVSEDMITKFNASQALQITTDARGADKPATSVSWNEAARFVNWLNTSTGGFAAYKFTMAGVNEAISLWDAIADPLDFDVNNPYRSLRANYVLPSVDEWYKAAYYDPTTGLYFDFPTNSGTAPTAVASGTDVDTAVYGESLLTGGPADIMSAGGLSPYGVMGMGGNVAEMEETAFSLSNTSGLSARGTRGGQWFTSASFDLSSLARYSLLPADTEAFYLGFRVVSLGTTVVPEPSSCVLALIGISGLLYRRRMRK